MGTGQAGRRAQIPALLDLVLNPGKGENSAACLALSLLLPLGVVSERSACVMDLSQPAAFEPLLVPQPSAQVWSELHTAWG